MVKAGEPSGGTFGSVPRDVVPPPKEVEVEPEAGPKAGPKAGPAPEVKAYSISFPFGLPPEARAPRRLLLFLLFP